MVLNFLEDLMESYMAEMNLFFENWYPHLFDRRGLYACYRMLEKLWESSSPEENMRRAEWHTLHRTGFYYKTLADSGV